MNDAMTRVPPSKREIAEVRRGEPLEQYRRTAAARVLDKRERDGMLKALERVLVGIYAHLPLKQARYGFDPVQRLRILRPQVKAMSDAEFNAEIGDIFANLRDAHTVYLRPGAKNRVVVLPFMLEMFGSVESPRYLVSKVEPNVDQPKFVRGVEVETWNGVPIDRVVQRHGESEAGGRADSMRGWAIMTLTSRSLEKCDMPDEDHVTIGFRTVDANGVPTGDRQLATFEWTVVDTSEVKDWLAKRSDPATGGARIKALNPTAAAVKRAKQLLFASNTLSGEAGPQPGISLETKIEGTIAPLTTTLPEYLKAGTIQGTGPGEIFGYLRLFHFDVRSAAEFLRELQRLLRQMPPRGLIIDIRENPGGVVIAAEVALQFLTPRIIEPVRFSMVATDFARDFCRQEANQEDFGKMLPSLEAAISNGERYSAPFPITDPRKCNMAGQVYGGPVVLITSATTYSSGDIFAAGFVDNDIGKMVCIGHSTGAGGACVLNYNQIRDAFGFGRDRLPELPEGAGLTFALARATRSGPNLGVPIEDVGVPSPEIHVPTRDDLLYENRDLLKKCVGMLRTMPRTFLQCTPNLDRGVIEVVTEGLDQLDVRINGKNLASAEVRDGATYEIPLPEERIRCVEVCGLSEGKLKQRRVMDDSISLPDA